MAPVAAVRLKVADVGNQVGTTRPLRKLTLGGVRLMDGGTETATGWLVGGCVRKLTLTAYRAYATNLTGRLS